MEVFEDRAQLGDWRVENIESDGSVDVVIFSGPRAETLAREYFAWRTGAVKQPPDFDIQWLPRRFG